MAGGDQSAMPEDLDLAWLRLELQRTRDSLAAGDVEGAFELADRAWQHVARAADRTEHRDQKTGRTAQASPEGAPCGGASRQDQVALLLWLRTEAELSDHSADRYRAGSAQCLLFRDRAKQFRAVAAALSPRPTYRHKKRGTGYVLLGVGKMQAEDWRERGWNDVWQTETFSTPVDMREVAIYRSADDGSLWVRPREEFEDGRFELIEAS